MHNGHLRTIRPIRAGTLIDHITGHYYSAEERFAAMQTLVTPGRGTKAAQIKLDEQLICVERPAHIPSAYPYAYFSTYDVGTRLVEYVVMDPNVEPNVEYTFYRLDVPADEANADILLIRAAVDLPPNTILVGPKPLDQVYYPDTAGVRPKALPKDGTKSKRKPSKDDSEPKTKRVRKNPVNQGASTSGTQPPKPRTPTPPPPDSDSD